MKQAALNRNSLAVWIGLAAIAAMMGADGAAVAQRHDRDQQPAPAADRRPLVARIGPVYGPEDGNRGRALPIQVVTDYIPAAREPVVRVDLDEARSSARMVCLDCDTGLALSPTRARRFSELEDGMTLVVVLETGNGMRGGRLESAKDGLRRVLSGNYRQGRDRLALVTIGKDVRVISDFSASDAGLLQAIDRIRPEAIEYPRLYWGMTQALQLFDQLDSTFPKRRRMLVISTGRNDAPDSQAAGAVRDNDVIERAVSAHVTIDAIGIPSPLPARTISLVAPESTGLPSENILIPAAQSMDSFLDALEKMVRGTGGLFLRQDPRGAPIAQRLTEGLQWLKDTPVLTFDLASAMRRDGRTHRVALRVSPQPGRDFEASIVMPPGWQFPYSTSLVVFVAVLLVLSFVALLKGRGRARQGAPVAAHAQASSADAPMSEFDRVVKTRDDTIRDPGVRNGGGGPAHTGGLYSPPASRSADPRFARSSQEPSRSATRVLTSSFPSPAPNSPCCTLRVLSGPRAGFSFPVIWSEASIGRESERNSITLIDPGISSCHATLRWNSGVITITDDHSTNGTRVGNVQLAPLRPHPLQVGDRIQMGSTILIIEAPFSAN